MSEDPVHRATRWHAFMHEDGGILEVLTTLRHAYFDRAADLMPNQTSELLKLGMAAKIVDQIEAHLQQIVTAGKIAQAAQDHADKIARLPEAKRRFL